MTTVIRLHDTTTERQQSEVVERISRTGTLPRVHSPTLVSSEAGLAAVSEAVSTLPQVAEITKITADYPKAAKQSRARPSTVQLGSTLIGSSGFTVIAGPCSVETPQQLLTTARAVRASGAHALRGGVFKPRTSPYSFQGLGSDGLDLVEVARQETGLPFVTEVVDVRDLDTLVDSVDMFQIGARNMQNYQLLKEIGKLRIPVLLKRGLAATVDETLMAVEYLLDGGNEDVVVCERGIRTFESSYRFTLDLTAVTVFRERTHLPVLVDPSHAAGERRRVIPLALAAAASGADGIIVETHCDPSTALCDGKQALSTEDLPELMHRLRHAVLAAGKRLVPLGHRPLTIAGEHSGVVASGRFVRDRAS